MNQTLQLTDEQKRLRRESLMAGGRQEAWTFIVQANWDRSQLQEKLAEKEAHRVDPDFAKGSMRPGASPRLFIDGFIAALKDAIEINDQVQSIETSKAHRYAAYNAGGRQAAWTFIVEQEWDIDAIRAKLADKEFSRDDPDTQRGSMAPGASPRLVIDGYIAALKEAIEIIESQQPDPILAQMS